MIFYALDFETATSDSSTICQIGLAKFVDGEVIEKFETLIRPESDFKSMNTSIHGITANMVEHAPTFLEVYNTFRSKVEGQVIASHGPFDRTALAKALKAGNMEHFDYSHLNTIEVVKKAWPQFSKKGSGLKEMCAFLDISLGKHHNALDDAIGTGKILLEALKATGSTLDDWAKEVERPQGD